MNARLFVCAALCFTVGCSNPAPVPDIDAATPDGGVDGAQRDAPGVDAPGVDAPGVDMGPRSCDDPDLDDDGADAIPCGGDDCDDMDPLVFPGSAEVCDSLDRDEDCEPTTFGMRDGDGDGFVDRNCCNQDGATQRCGDDCNDTQRTVTPLSTEACDHFDNDCDGTIDELVEVMGFADTDRDLHGDGTAARTGCAGDTGFSPVGDDCDDSDPLTHGAQHEVCNGIDDDCDMAVDEGAGAIDWWPDVDVDGFGDPDGTPMSSCTPVPEHRLLATDCDDSDPAVSPGAAETCDGTDEDCNGSADFEVAPGDREDDDRDGYPDAACATGARADCDDTDPTVSPGAAEIADGIDNDCDGTVDATCEMTSWWPDADGDGFGDAAAPMTRTCDPPAGHVTRAGDCDDGDGDRNPGMRDVCNGIDDDCDGEVDADAARFCVVPHALPLCTAGSCSIGLCERHYDDCDPARAGCESDTRVSALHCGVCGMRCPTGAHALPACGMAVCGLTCGSGYANCDMDLATGCERSTTFDPVNCGACGLTCSARDNAAPACTDGVCDITCNAGFANCDTMLGNGCEIDTSRDVMNCGGCGMACPIAGDVCVRGACTAPVYPSDGSDGDFLPTVDTVLAAGRHDFRDVRIPLGVTVRVDGDGTLDLRATGEIVIAGTLDVSGGRGGAAFFGSVGFGGGQGGATGTGVTGGDGTATACGGPAAIGGSGAFGSGGSCGVCGVGGRYGGGCGGNDGRPGGGGGGYAGGSASAGYAGGPSGCVGGAGASVGSVGTGGPSTPDGTRGRGGEVGLVGTALDAYAGRDGTGPGGSGGGGGGSIGAVPAGDLRVDAATFIPGSGGGGGGGQSTWAGCGGGGGGGALRLSSPVAIRITGSVLANGGQGGSNGDAQGGGGGSGGVVWLAAPEVRVTGATVVARGGAGGPSSRHGSGGAGGLGRIRISTLPELCTLSGTIDPPPVDACNPTPGAGMPAHTYVGVYPN